MGRCRPDREEVNAKPQRPALQARKESSQNTAHPVPFQTMNPLIASYHSGNQICSYCAPLTHYPPGLLAPFSHSFPTPGPLHLQFLLLGLLSSPPISAWLIPSHHSSGLCFKAKSKRAECPSWSPLSPNAYVPSAQKGPKSIC